MLLVLLLLLLTAHVGMQTHATGTTLQLLDTQLGRTKVLFVKLARAKTAPEVGDERHCAVP